VSKPAKIIYRAAYRLAPIDQEPVELEWLGDLNERETVFEKYRHAIDSCRDIKRSPIGLMHVKAVGA
jgi:hypothetical protein